MLRPDLGLVVADPDELRGGEPGQGVVAGDRDEPLRTRPPAGSRRRHGPCAGRSRGWRAAGRGPRRRAARRRASGRSARRRPHPPRRRRPSRARTGSPRPSRPTTAPGSCSLQSGLRDVVAVLGDADRDDRPGLVDEDGLGRGRRTVDAEDVAPSGSAVGGPDVLVHEGSPAAPGDRSRVAGRCSPEATLAASDSSDASPARMLAPSGPSQPA